ncbi:MAG TPA: hypothetical protein P5044_10435, partial [bacterium]|nr:hypothetical protein [bacterium]
MNISFPSFSYTATSKVDCPGVISTALHTTTESVADDLENSPFKGTLPHFLTQMGWLGLTPVHAYSVVNDGGTLIYT